MVVELQDPEVGSHSEMGVSIELSLTREVKGPRRLPSTPSGPLFADGETYPRPPPAGRSPQAIRPPLKGFRVLRSLTHRWAYGRPAAR